MKGNEIVQRSQKCVHGKKAEEVGFVQPSEVRVEAQFYVLFMKLIMEREHEYAL